MSSNKPCPTSLEPNQKYFWCTCGLTQKEPFCDGSHKGSGMKSLCFELDEAKNVYLCGCKKTKNPPYCDGSHNDID
jgi:CDGSH-type Zn-finger protein